MRLTQNFTLAEMTASQTAVRNGIDNTPDAACIENLRRLCNILEEIRTLVGKPITITSGFRGREVNATIGGSKNSQHMYGCAADFRITGLTPDEVIRIILTAGIKFDQLIREYDSWVHISVPLSGRAWRMECLIIDKRGARPYGPYEPLDARPAQKPLTKSRTMANATTAGATGAALVVTPFVEPASRLAETAQENPNGFIMVVGIVLLVVGAVGGYLYLDDRKKR